MLRPKWHVSVVFLLCVLYVMCMFQIFAESKQKLNLEGHQYKSQRVISDLVHDTFSELSADSTRYTWLCDALVYTSLGCTVVMLCTYGPRKRRTKRLSKFVFVVAILYLIRCFTIVATIMPNPDKGCIPNKHLVESNWMKGALLLVTGRAKTCSDEIFSGHTAIVVACSITWTVYVKNIVVLVLAPAYALLTMFVIAFTRFHYTIDVMIGFLLSLLLHVISYRRKLER